MEKTTSSRKETWTGMNWIRQEKRLALYLRDGLACCWCGATVEDGAKLTLDHCQPHSKGGSNQADNLITSCARCNSSRGDRPMAVFARAVAEYLDHGITAKEILTHINNTRKRQLPKDEAKTLIARRGSVARILAQF